MPRFNNGRYNNTTTGLATITHENARAAKHAPAHNTLQPPEARTYVSLAGLPTMVFIESLPFLLAPPSAERPKWTPPRANSSSNNNNNNNINDDDGEEDAHQQALRLLAAEQQRPFSQVIDGFLGGPANIAAHTIAAPLTQRGVNPAKPNPVTDEANMKRTFSALPYLRAVLDVNNNNNSSHQEDHHHAAKGRILSAGGLFRGAAAVDSADVVGGPSSAAMLSKYANHPTVDGSCSISSDILVKVTFKRKRVIRKNKRTGEKTVISISSSSPCDVTPVAVLDFNVAFTSPADWIFDSATAAADSSQQQQLQQQHHLFSHGPDSRRTLVLPTALTVHQAVRSAKTLPRVRCVSPIPTAADEKRAMNNNNNYDATAAARSGVAPPALALLRDAPTVPSKMPEAARLFLSRYSGSEYPFSKARKVAIELLEERPMWFIEELIMAIHQRFAEHFAAQAAAAAARKSRGSKHKTQNGEQQQQQQQQQGGGGEAAADDDWALTAGSPSLSRNSIVTVVRIVTYSFSGGPLSAVRIRFGFDPRQHIQDDSVIGFQVILLKPDPSSRRLLADIMRVPRATLQQKLQDLDEDVPVTVRAEHNFFSRMLMGSKLLMYLPLRDVMGSPHIRGMIEHGRKRMTFQAKAGGFLTNTAIGKIRRYMMQSLASWIKDTVAPQLQGLVKMMEFDDAATAVGGMGGAGDEQSSAALVQKWLVAGKAALDSVLHPKRAKRTTKVDTPSSASDDDDEDDDEDDDDDDDLDGFDPSDADDDGDNGDLGFFGEDEDESFAAAFQRQQRHSASSRRSSSQSSASPRRRQRNSSTSAAASATGAAGGGGGGGAVPHNTAAASSAGGGVSGSVSLDFDSVSADMYGDVFGIADENNKRNDSDDQFNL